MVSFITWEIWKARCSAVFEGGAPQPLAVLDKATRAAKEFLDANATPPTLPHPMPPSPDPVTRWIPPQLGLAKVNVDGAWKPDSIKAGLGVVIRTWDGLFCAGLACPYWGNSALQAEAAAAVKGLQLASQVGQQGIVMETDSKVLFDGVNDHGCSQAWSILPLLEEIRLLSLNFREVRWSWVSRNANRAAHKAA